MLGKWNNFILCTMHMLDLVVIAQYTYEYIKKGLWIASDSQKCKAAR